MNWIDISANKIQWKSIFGELTPPSEMTVRHALFEGNSIRLKIAAPMLGKKYPKKWLDEYNYFDFDLYLIEVSEVKIENFRFTGLASIVAKRIDTTDMSIDAEIEIKECKIKLKAKAIAILNISGFHNDGAV